MTKKKEEKIETISKMFAKWQEFFIPGKLYVHTIKNKSNECWNDPLMCLGIKSVSPSSYTIFINFLNKNGKILTALQYVDNNPNKWKRLK